MKIRPLLIHSGTHGDEYEVIESVGLAVNKYKEKLPDFVYIPVVSPSAVAQKTRKNKDGVDINRSFFDNSPISEVKANIEIVKNRGPFDLCVTFHEEPELSDFYMYQSAGKTITDNYKWIRFKKDLKALGVGLLNGIDAPLDKALGNEFVEGYRYFPKPRKGFIEHGEFDYWAINRGWIRWVLTVEVPMELDQKIKDRIVDLFFQYLLLRT